jgi:hypothetical protein
MHVMRLSLPMAVALAAVLTGAACGGSSNTTGGTAAAPTSSGATTSSVASSPAVAWVDKVCGEVLALVEGESAAPPALTDPDPAKSLKSFDEFITRNIDLVDQRLTNLRKAGSSPVAGGDEALTALINGLEALKKGYQAAKDRFATIDTRDPQAAQTAIVEAITSLGQGSADLEKAVKSVQDNKELQDASKQAPNCQKLDQSSSAPPSMSSTATTTS